MRRSFVVSTLLLALGLTEGCLRDEPLGPNPPTAIFPSLSLAGSPGQRLVGTEIRVTSSDATETTPTLGADPQASPGTSVVVFTSSAGGTGTVNYQRVSNSSLLGGPVLVGEGGTNDRLNDISGDYITYTSYLLSPEADPLGEVKLYEISSGTTTTISLLTQIFESRVHDRMVAWVEGAAGSTRVRAFDLDGLGRGGRPINVAGFGAPGTGLPANDVEIGSRLVVWSERGTNQFDVRAYDLNTGTYYDVATDPTVSESSPSTSGPWVTWQRGNGAVSIEAYNVDTGERRTVADNGAANLSPTIDGDLIAYESNLAGNFDIYLYRLSDGSTFQATSDPADQRLNNVLGDKVAYVDARNGNSDVFVTVFDFVAADLTPPVLALPPDITQTVTGRDGAGVTYTVTATDETDPAPEVLCAPASGSIFPLGANQVTCTATDEAGNNATGTFRVIIGAVAAEINVTPGSPPFPIRLSGPLPVISVLLRTTSTLDAALVNPGTATLGDGVGTDAAVATLKGRPLATLTDIDRDGDKDLLLVFKESDLALAGDLTTATPRLVLRAELTDGRQVRGEDQVRVIP